MALDMSRPEKESPSSPDSFEIIHWDEKERRHSVFTEKTDSYFRQSRVKLTDNIPQESDLFENYQAGIEKKKLGCWLATGICGNNITSSCLYVIALCAVQAGKFAPLALALIAGLLYLFRGIYTEVVEALPVNGGTYNLLLNTTSKSKATIAACLTMLSYVTTAVISSTSAMKYIQTMFADPDDFNVILWTIATLGLACFLNLMGIGESAIVALVIFLFHMVSVSLLLILGFYTVFTSMPRIVAPPVSDLMTNVTNATKSTMTVLSYNWKHTSPPRGVFLGLFYGYSNALLGISGFESSSNYVEEQKPGVFPKTLRNMWIAVAIINPLLALLAQCLMPVDKIAAQSESGALLSELAQRSSGEWLKTIIVLDGATVLIGAVIVAFVGFTGLSHRMTLDRCLPQVLLRQNSCRGTRHWIIIGFFLLTTALVLQTQGSLGTMAGIYTMAFLTVMILFTVGNMLIKLRRSSLPTPKRVPFPVVLLAFFMMLCGLLGNILSQDLNSIQGFIIFGSFFFIPVQVMLNRVYLMRILSTSVRPCTEDSQGAQGCFVRFFKPYLGKFIKDKIHDPLVTSCIKLEEKPLVFFTSNDDPPVLLDAIRYFLKNESRCWYKFVRVYEDKNSLPSVIPPIYVAFKKIYTDVQIDYVATCGSFGPEMVKQISFRYKVPANFMFMSSFGSGISNSFMELGGLRLITPNIKSVEEEKINQRISQRVSSGRLADLQLSESPEPAA